ncbi:hypothetical protein CPB97_002599, partial [Podila verticillata]
MEEASNNAIECGVCHLQRSSSYTCVSCVRSLLRQHWDAMKIQVAEKDLLAAQTNQVLSPKIKRYQMCLALRAMASEHSIAIAEERKLLQTELEQ